MPHRLHLATRLGLALALSLQAGGAAAQQPPQQPPQEEPRGKDVPPKPKDVPAKPKDAPPKGEERKPERRDEPRKVPQGDQPPKREQPEPPKPQAPPPVKAIPEAAPPAARPQPAPQDRPPVPQQPVVPQPVPPKAVQPVPQPPAPVPPQPATPKAVQPVAPQPAPVPVPQAPPKAVQPAPASPSVPAPAPPAAPPVPESVGKPARPQAVAPPPPPPAAPAPTPAAAIPPPAAPLKLVAPPAPAAVLPPAPASGATPGAFQPGFKPAAVAPQGLRDVVKGRTERVEDGGRRTIIQETDNRVIIKQDNRTIIRHDETQRFAKQATDVRSERRADGTTQTVIVQPGGIQIFNIVDNSGRLVRRYRRDERGHDVDIIDNRSFYRSDTATAIGIGLVVGAIALAVRAPEIHIPRERYIVDYERASDDDIYETLTAPPVERLERRYSLEEVRYSHELREYMPRLDLDAVTFESGSWEVGDEQFPKLERVARIMDRILEKRPGEVFMIEGHTDAVGSDVDNLTLSDRRAQAVAEILSGVFRVPAENMVTQGYGEQYLKVRTEGPERLNRRVAIRRITPLMSER